MHHNPLNASTLLSREQRRFQMSGLNKVRGSRCELAGYLQHVVHALPRHTLNAKLIALQELLHKRDLAEGLVPCRRKGIQESRGTRDLRNAAAPRAIGGLNDYGIGQTVKVFWQRVTLAHRDACGRGIASSRKSLPHRLLVRRQVHAFVRIGRKAHLVGHPSGRNVVEVRSYGTDAIYANLFADAQDLGTLGRAHGVEHVCNAFAQIAALPRKRMHHTSQVLRLADERHLELRRANYGQHLAIVPVPIRSAFA